MAIEIEKVQNKLRIHDGNTEVMDIDTSGVTIAGTLKVGGVESTQSISGLGTGYKLARGAARVALDGSNPTTVASGLTSILAPFVQLSSSTDVPGANIATLTAIVSGTNINVYAWKHSSTDATTLIASTDTSSFYWMCIGTD